MSSKFPYTIACWHGDVSGLHYERGGQPGDHQWAFDNSQNPASVRGVAREDAAFRRRDRDDEFLLLPCCGDDSPGAEAPAWAADARPYAPVDHDNRNYHATLRGDAPPPATPAWVFARHAAWGADEAARAAADGCVGESAGLDAADCAAWRDLYDASGGNASWTYCGEYRDDPCACLTFGGEIACADRGGQKRIVAVDLEYNGLVGTIPASLADMAYLAVLQIEGNHLVRSRPGLGGALPALPFHQYVGCGVEGNAWTCPLPPGAAEFCSQGQPLSCVEV